MSELKFQRALIKELKEIQGHGWKSSNQFLAGIPDLVMIHPDYPACFIETKVVKVDQMFNGKIIPIKTTPLQKANLRKIQSAGGMAGIVVLVDHRWPQYLYITADIDMPHFKFGEHPHIQRRRGWPYLVKALIHSIYQHQKKLYQKVGEEATEIGSINPKSKLILN